MGIFHNGNICHKSYIPLSSEARCRGEQCHECNYCGWNPDVNRRRRQMIRQRAESGSLGQEH